VERLTCLIQTPNPEQEEADQAVYRNMLLKRWVALVLIHKFRAETTGEDRSSPIVLVGVRSRNNDRRISRVNFFLCFGGTAWLRDQLLTTMQLDLDD
jgi:hypothetical protein